jgi:hypothetical protein
MKIEEFQCIMPIENISSVMKYGILCHELAGALPHESIAMDSAQEKRDKIELPDGRPLHEFANVYFHARNPMMYCRKEKAGELCVLKVSSGILDIQGVWVSNGNAASRDYAKFCKPKEMGSILDFDLIYAERWADGFTPFGSARKHAKCAEALVPDEILPSYITGAYVIDLIRKQKLEDKGFHMPISIDPDLFFKTVPN